MNIKKNIIFIVVCSIVWVLSVQLTKDLIIQGSLLLLIGWMSGIVYGIIFGTNYKKNKEK